jgi:PPOX class probable F420-dependent enzyme
MSLKKAQYINLGTFRKDGRCVETPVWFAQADNFLYVFTNNQSGKVKRLRNSSQCCIAPCTFSGSVTGSWQDATALLLDSKETIKTAHAALRKKYGLSMLFADCGSTLIGKIKQRSYIQICLPESRGD